MLSCCNLKFSNTISHAITYSASTDYSPYFLSQIQRFYFLLDSNCQPVLNRQTSPSKFQTFLLNIKGSPEEIDCIRVKYLGEKEEIGEYEIEVLNRKSNIQYFNIGFVSNTSLEKMTKFYFENNLVMKRTRSKGKEMCFLQIT